MTLRPGTFVLALLLGGVATSALAVPLRLPGFPVKVDGIVRQAAAMVDLDGDGQQELVVEANGKLTLFNADGKVKRVIDVAALTKTNNPGVVGPVAVGDLDGDGKMELALAFSYGDVADGSIVVVKQDGTAFFPLPIPVPKGPGAGPTFADVNGDGKMDLVFGAKDGTLTVIERSGKPMKGFPVQLHGTLSSPVSFGSLVRGQKPALAVGTMEGRVYAVLPDGEIAKGFPVETRFAITGAPAFGDIDNDGEHEIVVASQDFKVYAINADGSIVGAGLQAPYFPVSAAYRIYGGPALADLDHDGSLDIIVGAGDGKIYAWSSKGRMLPGFPVSAGGRLYTSVVVGDGDRDGFDEVYAAGGDGNLYGFDGKGKAIDGFPMRISGELQASPVLGDLVKDPNLELVIGGTDGSVQGFRLQRTGDLPMGAISWPEPGHDPSRQGHFGPNPPRYRTVAITPEKVRAGQPIKLSYEFYDLDGDPEPKTILRWMVDGTEQPDLEGKREIPGDRVKKGHEWKAVLQAPEDFAIFKEGPSAQLYPSNTLKVQDTPPSPPKIAVAPDAPKVVDSLSVTIVQPASDVDGDAMTYKYRWFRDGEPAGTAATVDGKLVRKGERWRVQVTANDGELDGAPTEAETTILNSVPTAPEISVAPAGPTIDSDVVVSVTKPSTDADNEPLEYRYAFSVNGQLQALPPERKTFPKLGARKGDTVAVEAWAIDADTEGPRAKAEVKVANSPPGKAKASIVPASPKTDDALTAGIDAPSHDPDGDAVSYRVQWKKDGAPFGEAGQLVVPATETKKGEKWAVELVPTDGELDGPVATAEVTIQNSAPGKATLAVTNATPDVDETAVISVLAPATDPDGDEVHYEYAWIVDGKAVSGAKDKTTLAPGEFKKNQKWLVEAMAVDAEGGKGPAATMEIRPRNTPPAAPVVALEPKTPTIETGLKATIAKAAPDRDGDAITYRYKWFRDGVLATDAGDRALLKPGDVKHGQTWRVVVTPFDGDAEGASADASATVGDVAPTAPQVATKPAHPTVVTGLSCEVTKPAKDADADTLALSWRWFRDGQLFTAASDRTTIPGDALRTGQSWKCEATAKDAELASPAATASATIEDAGPSAPDVAISPAAPKAGNALTCAVTKPAVDPDGDRLGYEFKWTPPTGVTLGKLDDPARIPGKLVKKGQPWKCDVTAKDAKLSASASAAEVKVGNTVPRAPRLKLTPADASTGAELRCDFADPAVDPDGDPVTYAFVWFRNGERQSFAETSAGVPGRMVKAGDKWRCQATASDPDGAGGTAHGLEVVVQAGSATAGR